MIALPYKERIILDERTFVEMDIKEVSNKEYKFSLVLIRDEKRIIGFDNHEGRTPHKHVQNKIYHMNLLTLTNSYQIFMKKSQK